MLFRTKDATLINIVRSSFNSDIEYYSYIKNCVVGKQENLTKKDTIVDVVVSLVKKNSVGRIAYKSK